MGFLSQQITAPNFDHYAYPQREQIGQSTYEGNIQAYQQYMNGLWTQWGDYAKIVAQTTTGLQEGGEFPMFNSAPFMAAIDSAYSTGKDKLNRSHTNQRESLEKETGERKKTASANLGFRGLGNTTTRGQVTGGIQNQSDEIQGQYDEAYNANVNQLDAQKTEWLYQVEMQEQTWNAERARLKKQAADQLLSTTASLQSGLVSMQPHQLDPGPGMTGDYLSNLINQAQAAQNPNVVTGEEGGWGGLALTGIGAGWDLAHRRTSNRVDKP